jgi:Na+-driven multidrug efflux pump
VASSAIATIVSFIVAATGWLAWRLHRINSPLAPDAEFSAPPAREPGKILKTVLKVGVPTGVQTHRHLSCRELRCSRWSTVMAPTPQRHTVR